MPDLQTCRVTALIRNTPNLMNLQRCSSVKNEQPERPIIELLENGPIVAKNVPHFRGPDGEDIEPKQVMALCRCGASRNKPFCDGSHSTTEFRSTPSEERTSDRVRTFEGQELTIYYSRLLCSHAGECGKRLKTVFDSSRKPWIAPDNASREDIAAVITARPSGALSYGLRGEPPQHIVKNEVAITIEKCGPYHVNRIGLAEPHPIKGGCADKYVLCRCGHSRNKPYCDGTHKDIGWKD